MFGSPYYHKTLKNYVSYFGTLFNGMSFERFDRDGILSQTIFVPVSYASKEKADVRVENDPEIDRPAAAILPRMHFELAGLAYDESRKLNTINKIVRSDEGDNTLKYMYNEVPYNIEFKLYVYAKYMEDGLRIIEQILPNFTPGFTATLELIPELDIRKDVPIVYNNCTLADENAGAFIDRRVLVWTLDFTMKAYIFGPVKSGGIIKLANVNFFTAPGYGDGELADAVGHVDPNERLTARPGLLANGSPTTNIALTIPYNQINAADNYAYIVQIENLDPTGD